MPKTATDKPNPPVLEVIIKYRVEVQYANLEETLDHLRGMGSAEVLSATISTEPI